MSTDPSGFDGPPPPPPGATPPPLGAPMPPPPAGSSAEPLARPVGLPPTGRYATAAGVIIAKTEAQIKDEKRRDREALRRLAAAPEMVMCGFVVFVAIVAATATSDPEGQIILIIILSALAALFGWLAVRSGDAIIYTLVLGAAGFLTAIALGATLNLDVQSLWWIVPAVVVIAFENAFTYNYYRRRSGDISATVRTTHLQNMGAIVAGSLVLAVTLRWLTNRDGQVSWIWYATVLSTAIVLSIGSLITIRRRALPADRRRFSPGRRMIPPPA
ncbi:MAG: hypothetical protein HKN03_08680 [Acidimicrobiales bacterium]|nr:hypothetical protein [Acidimicrobiales bacterium]